MNISDELYGELVKEAKASGPAGVDPVLHRASRAAIAAGKLEKNIKRNVSRGGKDYVDRMRPKLTEARSKASKYRDLVLGGNRNRSRFSEAAASKGVKTKTSGSIKDMKRAYSSAGKAVGKAGKSAYKSIAKRMPGVKKALKDHYQNTSYETKKLLGMKRSVGERWRELLRDVRD